MSSEQSNAVDRTDTVTIKPASAEEKALRAKFGQLNDAQIRVLMQELDRQSGTGSPLELNLQDQQTLDTAFDSARNRFMTESQDYADMLAGGRGLRMSDTPIAQQAFSRLGLGLGDIESQRANAGLTLGLQTNDYRTRAALGLSNAVPAAGAFNLGQYLQERMAQPSTRSTGYGSGTMMPSGISSAGQLAGGIGALGMGAAAAYGAVGAGSAAAAGTTALGVTGLGLA